LKINNSIHVSSSVHRMHPPVEGVAFAIMLDVSVCDFSRRIFVTKLLYGKCHNWHCLLHATVLLNSHIIAKVGTITSPACKIGTSVLQNFHCVETPLFSLNNLIISSAVNMFSLNYLFNYIRCSKYVELEQSHYRTFQIAPIAWMHCFCTI